MDFLNATLREVVIDCFVNEYSSNS